MAWLTNWNYRKAITISNAGSALLDYQVLITIDTATSVTALKMRSDCGDIRFTDTDGSTLLNYWIESGQNTVSTYIWVKIPSVPIGSNTIYMYYGNPSAIPVSNGTNTFILFDDGTSLTGWNSPINNFQIINNNLKHITIDRNFARKSIVINDYIVEGLIQTPSTSGTQYAFVYGRKANTDVDTGVEVVAGIGGNNALYSIWKGDVWITYGVPGSIQINTWYAVKLVLNGTNAELYADTGQTHATTLRLSTATVSVLSGETTGFMAGFVANQLFDDFRVRKYASPEPTFSISVTEEIPSNITATLMTITQSETPCRVGICTVTVNVTWTNNGGTSGDFIPNITIDGIPYSSPYPLQSLGSGLSDTKTFIISGLAVGTRNICPYPN